MYVAVTAFLGRDVLSNLSTHVANDEGDPLFVAAVLHWNATRLPLSEGWWQFPIFQPTRDALTFSEHFLGLAPLSMPLHWITGDPLTTYNLVMLLTFPLCGLAMFALVHRLTGHAAAAFVAGLAFAFAPYRFSHLSHLQILAFFWAPLVFLGLHAYVGTRRRRWLVLYAVAWMLQGASNGYALVFVSVLVGLWVIWFVVARRDWSALAAIAVSTLVAAVSLTPILTKYVSVHALHGFTRDPFEISVFSADLAALFCASPHLAVWGSLRVGCRAEGELFPGAAVAILSIVAIFRLTAGSAADTSSSRALTWVSRALLAVALLYIAVICSVIIAGPWRIELGPLRMSASSIAKPVIIATIAMLLGLSISPRVRSAARTSSVAGFYFIAAVLTWLFALGPIVTFMGTPRWSRMPFALLMYLPGVQQLRVPARFWLLTTMCLAVLVGLLMASLLQQRRRSIVVGAVCLVSALLLADGWVARIVAVPVPGGVPDPSRLRNALVLQLPTGTMRDIAAEYRAVTGGWRSVNGYSGYEPGYYAAVLDAATNEEDDVIVPFRALEDLHVVVDEGASRLRSLVEAQPGVMVTARSDREVQYLLPRRVAPLRVGQLGERRSIHGVRASCHPTLAAYAADGDERTHWDCGPQVPGQELVVDLGRESVVGAVVQNLGNYAAHFPRHLVIESSRDGRSWEPAWDGSIRTLLIAQALERPAAPLKVGVPFAPRAARYIRMRQTGRDERFLWAVPELEVYTGPPPTTTRE